MPEEAPPKKDSIEDFIWILLVLVFVVQVFTVIPKRIQEHTGINILHPVQSIKDQAVLGANTPLGTGVRTTIGTDVFSAAKEGTLLGFQGSGAVGKLFGGPESVDGQRWWNVNFAQGTDGWVAEDALVSTGTWVSSFISWYTVIGFAVSFLFLILVLYFTFQINTIRGAQARKLKAQVQQSTETKQNYRWERVIAHANSGNPGDWRLAIIEADVMLDEVVTRMGYRGASLGDKLKQVDVSDMTTLNDAWEAHKTRNRVAHSGSDFILTQREAKRVVDLYANVFKELHYI